MAKIILSALLDSLTGKLAGSVFQQSNGGLQVRTRVSPRDPRSALQVAARQDFSFNASNWPLLTVPERASWNDNSPVGVPGVSFFLDINAKINTTGQPLLPEYTGSGTIFAPVAAYAYLGAFTMGIDSSTIPDPIPADEYVNLFFSPRLSPGVSFISPSQYRHLISFAPGQSLGAAVDITVPYEERFGSIQNGDVIGYMIYSVNVATGDASAKSFVVGQAVP